MMLVCPKPLLYTVNDTLYVLTVSEGEGRVPCSVFVFVPPETPGPCDLLGEFVPRLPEDEWLLPGLRTVGAHPESFFTAEQVEAILQRVVTAKEK